MGGSSSRKKPKTNFPPYTPAARTSPGINRPGAAAYPGAAINNQPRDLAELSRDVANMNMRLQTLQHGAPPMPYGGGYGMPPMQMPYGYQQPYAAPAPAPAAPAK